MGQSVSTSVTADGLQTAKTTRKQLESAFIKQATSLFNPIDLYTLKTNLHVEELNGTYTISREQLFGCLGLPLNFPAAGQFFNSLKFISKCPLFQNVYDDEENDYITIYELVKLITILNKEKYGKLFDNNKRIFLFIIYNSLSFHNKTQKEKEKYVADDNCKSSDTNVDCVLVNNKIQWSYLPIMQSCDEIEVSKSPLIASQLYSFITFLLIISDIASLEKANLPMTDKFNELKQWAKYQKKAACLVRTFDANITPDNYDTVHISFPLFEKTIDSCIPNLFNSLHYVLQSLLYSQPASSESATGPTNLVADNDGLSDSLPNSAEMELTKSNLSSTETRLMTKQMLAQLSTFLPSELVYSRLMKLYTGSEHGFSINAMRGKMFMWNAPSIFLVSGKRIDESKPNKRYETFKNTFPKLHKNFTRFDNSLNDDHSIVTYGVYVKQPWRVSNTTAFGDSTFEMFELSPRQHIFKGVSSSALSNNYCYFTTNGGGIGFGSPPPKIKSKGDITYSPGAVSLTIDPTIEFAVFRNLSIGGYYRSTGSTSGDIVEYEDRFQITDLEVWGCGSEEDLKEQQKRWEWENREAKARQQLNIKDGRALLEMAGIIGNGNDSGGSV